MINVIIPACCCRQNKNRYDDLEYNPNDNCINKVNSIQKFRFHCKDKDKLKFYIKFRNVIYGNIHNAIYNSERKCNLYFGWMSIISVFDMAHYNCIGENCKIIDANLLRFFKYLKNRGFIITYKSQYKQPLPFSSADFLEIEFTIKW